MDQVTLIAIGAALSQLVLALVLLLAGQLNQLSKNLFMVLLGAAVCYLLIPLFPDWQGAWLLGAASTLIPGTFWVFCASIFDDHYEFPLWQPTLVLLTVALPSGHLLMGEPAGWSAWLLVDLPQMTEFVLLGAALWIILRNWRDDLVAPRRQLRLWLCGGLGAIILTVIASREVFFSGEHWLTSAQYVVTALAVLGANFLLLRFQPGPLDPILRLEVPSASVTENPVSSDLAAIIEQVRSRALHRRWGLTIGKLGEIVGMPEHQLRKLINSSLGYRNFNDFLNRFRIEEAATRLADPEQARVPVLTIALEAGFRSISTFNKVFKDARQITPTEYRRQSLDTG